MNLSSVRIVTLAFLACVMAIPATAVADGWFKEMDEDKEVTLGELLRKPRDYLDVQVRLKLYFDRTGKNFNPYYTRFMQELYGNFSAWPIDARLYEKRDFQRAYPNFFVKRRSARHEWDSVQELDRITPIEVKAYVRDVFRGQPWIEVVEIDKVRRGLREENVRNAVKAEALFAAGRFADAARHYRKALGGTLPATVSADLNRRMGDALYAAGEYSDAQDAYEEGLDDAPDSAVLKRGALAARHAYERMRGFESAQQREADETPAPRSEPVSSAANDVDEIIKAFEDPAEVEAEVERYRAEIEERAARARSGADATLVSGTEETVPAPEEKEAAAPGEEGESAEQDVEVVEPDGGAEEAMPEDATGQEPAEQDGCATEVPADVETPEQPADVETPEETADVEMPEQPADVEMPEETTDVETPEQPADVETPEETTDVETPEQPADVETPEETTDVETPEQPADVEMPEETADVETPEQPVEETPVEVEAPEGDSEDVVVVEPEEPAPTVEEVLQAHGADAGDDGCAVAIDIDEPVEVVADEPAAEESPEEVVMDDPPAEDEGCAETDESETPEEVVMDEPAEEETPEIVMDDEGCSEMTEEGVVGEEEMTDEMSDDVFASDDPRVVMVAGTIVRLPRLPFFGCEDVSYDQFRAVLEEILRNPEQ